MAQSRQESRPLILVTGASQGIGAAIAECFAAQVAGARLALVARNRDKLEDVALRCRQAGAAEAEVFVADLCDNGQVTAMARAVEARFGAVDVLVNNAGRWRGGAAHEMPVEEFSLVLQENLVSMFAVTRALLPAMLARGSGDIFLVSSTYGLSGAANNAAYCAAKHGVAGYAKALRTEVAAGGLRVCCVFPGPTETPTWDGSGVDVSTLMSAEDVARVFVDAWRLSPRSAIDEIVLRPPASG